MILDGKIKKFQIELSNGYCEVTQLAQIFVSPAFARGNVPDDQDLPDTKFTVVSLWKLQVVRGDIISEINLSGPERESRTYRLFGESFFDEIAEAMDRLSRRLLLFRESLPRAARQQIISDSRKFLDEVVERAVLLDCKAVWANLTFVIVEKEDYDERSDTHRLVVAQVDDPNGRTPACSVCNLAIDTDWDCMRMPCNDRCHLQCIWTWPRQGSS